MTTAAAQPDALAEIQANQARLDRCKGPHAFAAVDPTVPVFRTQHECAHCGGRVDWQRRHWYEQGLAHQREPAAPHQDERIGLIALCELPTTAPFPSGDKARMPNLKHLLWTIWSHEGEPLPRRRLVELTGLSSAHVDRCIHALMKIGVVTTSPTRTASGGATKKFTINTDELRKLQLPPIKPANFSKRLTLDDAREIHRLREDGSTIQQIAEHFKIHPSTVAGILRGDRWKQAMPK